MPDGAKTILQGRIAIVTGAGQGMGRGIAEKLAEYGAALVATDKDESKAKDTAHGIGLKGGKAFAVRADITDIGDIIGMFGQCGEVFGAPDIFVANAGLSYSSSLLETTEEEFDKVFGVNAKGTFFCIKEAGLRLNDGGRIVAISSSTTKYPKTGMSLYSSTKAAVNMMTEIAARELADRRITVNAILPGLTVTPFMDLPDEYKQMVIGNTPFKRLGTPEDIAEAVAFLCTKEAEWINGQLIIADGGCVC